MTPAPSPQQHCLTWPRRYDFPVKAEGIAQQILAIKLASARRAQALSAMKDTFTAKGGRSAKKLSRRYATSWSVHTDALKRANVRRGLKLDGTDPAALDQFFSDLREVNMWVRSKDRSVAFPRMKADGETKRYVFSAPMVRYAAELIMKDIAQALTVPLPTQFMSARGRPAFEVWLASHLPDAALVLTTDIPSCFNSILRDRIGSGLPLPGRAMKEVLFRPMDEARFLDFGPQGLVLMDEDKVARVRSSQRGIPQGSAPASVVSEYVIGKVLRTIAAVSPEVRVASYGDNLIVLLSDPALEQPVLHALTSSVALEFGPDVIDELTRRTEVFKPSQKFSFCGRFYQLRKGALKISLDEYRAGQFGLKTGVKLERARHLGLTEYEKIERSVHGWIAQNASFPVVVKEGVELLLAIRKSIDRLSHLPAPDEAAPKLVNAPGSVSGSSTALAETL